MIISPFFLVCWSSASYSSLQEMCLSPNRLLQQHSQVSPLNSTTLCNVVVARRRKDLRKVRVLRPGTLLLFGLEKVKFRGEVCTQRSSIRDRVKNRTLATDSTLPPRSRYLFPRLDSLQLQSEEEPAHFNTGQLSPSVIFLNCNQRVWEWTGHQYYNPESGGFIGAAVWLENGAGRSTCVWLCLRSRKNPWSTSESGGCVERVKACPMLHPWNSHSTRRLVPHLWPLEYIWGSSLAGFIHHPFITVKFYDVDLGMYVFSPPCHWTWLHSLLSKHTYTIFKKRERERAL